MVVSLSSGVVSLHGWNTPNRPACADSIGYADMLTRRLGWANGLASFHTVVPHRRSTPSFHTV